MNLVVLANLKRVDLAVRECGCEGEKYLKGVKFHRNRWMRKQVTGMEGHNDLDIRRSREKMRFSSFLTPFAAHNNYHFHRFP